MCIRDRGKEAWPVKTVVKISVLGVISFSLMFLKTPLWFTPPFLKFDISDLPSVIGAFAMGPGTGVWIQLIKNTLNVLDVYKRQTFTWRPGKPFSDFP